MNGTDKLRAASHEIKVGTARPLGSVSCGPCREALATLYATSVGEVWRIPNRDSEYFNDELASRVSDLNVTCRRHGQATVSAADIAAQPRRSKPWRIFV